MAASSKGFHTAVDVQDYRALMRAFARADKTIQKEVKSELKGAAEPVRSDAERIAVESISHIGLPWSRMRVGITRRSVYVAPRRRNKGGSKRKNLAGLLMGEAMIPALERNEGETVARVNKAIDEMCFVWAL